MSHVYDDPKAQDRPEKQSSALVLGLGASLVGMALVAAVLLWGFVFKSGPNGTPIRSPEEVARDYFDALASGSAHQALALAETQPTVPVFATADVLADSLSRALLTGIDVTGSTVTGEEATVTVDYRLGEQDVHARLEMVLRDKQWRLRQATGTIDLSALLAQAPGLTFMGQPFTGQTKIEVFPGVYRFGLDQSSWTLTNPEVTVPSPGQVVKPGDVGLALTDTAQQQVGDAARAKLQSCLDENAFMASEGCGFGFKSTQTGATGATTTTWTVSAGSLDGVVFAPVTGTPNHATAAISVTLTGAGIDTNGSRFQSDQILTHANADLTDPAHPVITFGRG